MTPTLPVVPPGPRVGFLHTSPVHVAPFDVLVAAADPTATSVSVVEEALLSRARAGTSDIDLRDGVRAALESLTAAGAAVIVCTCSTIGALAEDLGREGEVPVVRVDRPMADRAVGSPGRRPGSVHVLVAVALASTLGPTTDLLTASAAAAGRAVEIDVLRCDDAWPLFEAGCADAFVAAVAQTVRAALDPRRAARTASADVVVLAQASMAPAAGLLGDLVVPVLTSPREAVRYALEVAREPSDLSG